MFTVKMSHHFQVLFICNLGTCVVVTHRRNFVQSKNNLHNCWVAIKEFRFDSSLLFTNLLIDCSFCRNNTKKLQIVLVYTLYINVHTCTCIAIYLVMLVGGLKIY